MAASDTCSSQHKAIACILLGFDFAQAQAVMQLMQWRWGHDILSVARLRQAARELLLDLLHHPDAQSMECGGLRAERFDNDGVIELRLTFEAVGFSVECEAPDTPEAARDEPNAGRIPSPRRTRVSSARG